MKFRFNGESEKPIPEPFEPIVRSRMKVGNWYTVSISRENIPCAKEQERMRCVALYKHFILFVNEFNVHECFSYHDVMKILEGKTIVI